MEILDSAECVIDAQCSKCSSSGVCKDWYSLLEGLKTQIQLHFEISEEKGAIFIQQSDMSDSILEDHGC